MRNNASPDGIHTTLPRDTTVKNSNQNQIKIPQLVTTRL